MKLGDTVLCVDDKESTFLKKNCKYKLLDQNRFGNWQVKEEENNANSSHFYKPSRFRLLKNKKKVDLSKKYTNKRGETIKIFNELSLDSHWPIVGCVFCDGHWVNETWDLFGKSKSSLSDLIEIPESIDLNIRDYHVTVFADGSIYIEYPHKPPASFTVGEYAKSKAAFTKEEFMQIARAWLKFMPATS